MKKLFVILVLILASIASFVVQDSFAHGDAKVGVEALISEMPADLSGKRITMLAVTYPPGVSFHAHRHPGSVLVYVASGEIQSQLATDEAPITYKAGEYWYEDPTARHIYSKNPSDSIPAKIIAILVGDDGAELVLPDEEKE